jgi:DNA adenine methylase
VDERWDPEKLCAWVQYWHELFSTVDLEVTYLDWRDVLNRPDRALLYLDPPYWTRNKRLYLHDFGKADHMALASALHSTPHVWLLSYDDSSFIRELYDWADIMEISIGYSLPRAYQGRKELLIMPRGQKTNGLMLDVA